MVLKTMQRPRRTREFHEDIGDTCSKRQARHNGPSPVPSTSKKNTTRQSRIARPNSLDRGSLFSSLAPPTNSAMRGNRVTPQKTPLRSVSVTRVLFTAEHNDKKWQQEQMQRITKHLCAISATGAIVGIGADFFARPACLRQLSVKQFVAVVNYFLHAIAGSRQVVGANYVDDIVSHLQKLKYPHQVNKSWLKTPNTQHSFGNILLLFDFFMDLVAPASELQFPLLAPEELNADLGPDFAIPDNQFQSQLLHDSEQGFMLWDKNLQIEFLQLQQQTCDELIRKRCNVEGVAALDVEVRLLRRQYDELEQRSPPTRHDEEERCQQCEQDLKCAQQQIETLTVNHESNADQVQVLQEKKRTAAKEAADLEEEIAKLKTVIRQQPCSVGQRDQYIEIISQKKHMLQSHKRTVRSLQDRTHQQQVQVSRTKKKLTDQVEKFNVQMREMSYVLPTANADELQLPLKLNAKHLKRPFERLKKLRSATEEQLAQLTRDLVALEDRMAELEHEIETKLETERLTLQTALSSAQKYMLLIEHESKSECAERESQIVMLNNEISEIDLETRCLCGSVLDTRQQISDLEEANETYMADIERRHQKYIDIRTEELMQNEAALKDLNAAVDRFEVTLNKNEVWVRQITNIEKELAVNETKTENEQ